ncbi:putative replication protein [Anopheles sinensis]|uniref:Putative replication protein n=1 Tax=Anopheles sinensis TaxID=74873 RepID=A0A084WCH3_ANOSI|nr:putative replication protein [Anopheles sinensis]
MAFAAERDLISANPFSDLTPFGTGDLHRFVGAGPSRRYEGKNQSRLGALGHDFLTRNEPPPNGNVDNSR